MKTCKMRGLLITLLSIFTLSSCIKLKHDHENNYKVPNRAVEGAVVGNVAGLAVGIASPGNAPLAVVAGTAIGGGIGLLAERPDNLLSRLNATGVQVIRYGDNVELVLPSDSFFETDSAKLRRDRFSHMIEVAALLKNHSKGRITISAHSDDVGSGEHKSELTFEQAQSVMTYLWAHGIDFHRIRAIGYGDQMDVAKNDTIQGSAFNRRVEIHFKLPVKRKIG